MSCNVASPEFAVQIRLLGFHPNTQLIIKESVYMRANRSRKHRIEVAMNDQEYEEFMKHIKECGLSKQSYLLQLVKNRIPQPLPSDDFQEVIRQLRRIGNNINQVAVIANKNGSIDILKFNKAKQELDKQIVEIRKQVYLPKEITSNLD